MVIVLCYRSAFVDGQLQTTLKGISGGNTFQQNDSNNKQLSRSSFRHELDGDHSVVPQLFPYESSGSTQVNFLLQK